MEERLKDLIEKPILESGYILDSVQYVEENGTKFLRVVIDKLDNYITVNDCVAVNDLLNPILDEVDFIEESYILDICSKEKGSE